MSMKRASRSALGSFGFTLAIRTPAVAISLCDFGQNLLEIRGFPEIAVNRCKAHVGDRVQSAHCLADELSDRRRRNFRLARAFQLSHDARNHALDALAIDGAFSQRNLDGAQKLVAIERHLAP